MGRLQQRGWRGYGGRSEGRATASCLAAGRWCDVGGEGWWCCVDGLAVVRGRLARSSRVGLTLVVVGSRWSLFLGRGGATRYPEIRRAAAKERKGGRRKAWQQQQQRAAVTVRGTGLRRGGGDGGGGVCSGVVYACSMCTRERQRAQRAAACSGGQQQRERQRDSETQTERGRRPGR